MLATVALLAVTVGTLVWAYSRYRHNYWAARGVPTAPGSLPLLGHTHKLFSRNPSRWLYFDEVYKNHGGAKFCGLYNQFEPTLIVGDPELVKDVLIKDFNHFVDRRSVKFTSVKDELFNELLNRASGDHWRSLRSVLSPNFASGRMKEMFPLVGLKADALVDYIHRKLQTQPVIPVRRCFGLYTLEVISSCAFGMETNSFTDENSPFNTVAEKLFKTTPAMFLKFFLFRLFPKLCAALKINFAQPEMEFLKDVVKEAMKQREKGERRGDFLDLMMEARQHQKETTTKSSKYPVTANTVMAQSVLFLLAGYDTTANTLSFVTFLLAQYPQEQQRLRQELKNLIKEHGAFTYQAIMEAKYLAACVSEALRLYPPAHFTERQCTNEYTIPGTDVIIPRKTIVSVPIWSLHHDPHYWSDPEVFRPYRFLLENKDIKSGTYLPFGLGPRNCIGMRFALMEAKMALAKVVLEFEVRLTEGRGEMKLSSQFGIMRPSSDLALVFTPTDKD